jgi:hypothetical protein
VETHGITHVNELGLIKTQLTAQGVAAADLGSSNPTELKKVLEVWCAARSTCCA